VKPGLYDKIGRTYVATRRADQRIARAIRDALGDAWTVLNVGAGAGAYEPPDLEVTAVEPSATMIAQRPPGSAAVISAVAEALPFDDGSFDAAMAVLSDHHWRDRAQGLRELVRVARRRVVLFNADPGRFDEFWFTTEYMPEFLTPIPSRYRIRGAWQDELEDLLGPVRLLSVPIPHDCADGFYGAFWRRPSAYLDPQVRAGISSFAALPENVVSRAVETLDADIRSGEWHARHSDLLRLPELDLGYYVVVAELAAP
jgi:SAM-dependent methyltransferase